MIDDERDLLRLAKIMIEGVEEEIEIETSISPREALKKIKNKLYNKNFNYDVIVADLKMPDEMDGIDLVEEIRELGIDIPYIIYTGKGSHEEKVKALNKGADRYVEKSGDPSAGKSGIKFEELCVIMNREHEKYLEKKES